MNWKKCSIIFWNIKQILSTIISNDNKQQPKFMKRSMLNAHWTHPIWRSKSFQFALMSIPQKLETKQHTTKEPQKYEKSKTTKNSHTYKPDVFITARTTYRNHTFFIVGHRCICVSNVKYSRFIFFSFLYKK